MITTAQFAEMLARTNRNPIRDAKHSPSVERERKLHEQVLAEVERRGWLAVHSRMDRPSRTGIGTPDFIVIADAGRTFLIECKAGANKLTRPQANWLALARHLGHRAAVIHAMSEFFELVSTDPEKREQL